ncbi:MAG: DUF4398 domain-containing protein [Myxococcales bacterium]
MHATCRPAACLLVLLAAGCGPVRATSVVGDAETAVARARAADGERLAPYETIAAELYLEKAREQRGRAQYGAAEDLAQQSLRFARDAVERAGEQRGRVGAAPAPTSPATVTRPPPSPEQPAPRNQ